MAKFKGRGILQVTGRNSIEDNTMDAMAKAIQENIDREILETIRAEQLQKKGWIKSPVERPRGLLNDWHAKTANWCHLHCTGDYRLVLGCWWFERPVDATAFTLKWA